MTVKELIAELQKIKVPADVYFPNMEVDQLELVVSVKVKDTGDHGWIRPESRYNVILG